MSENLLSDWIVEQVSEGLTPDEIIKGNSFVSYPTKYNEVRLSMCIGGFNVPLVDNLAKDIVENNSLEAYQKVEGFTTALGERITKALNHFKDTPVAQIGKNRPTGIKDIDGEEIHENDIVSRLYLTPCGRLDEELDEDFRYKVEFKYGAFGVQTPTKFIPLIEYLKQTEGEYISNKGNVIIYGDSILKIIEKGN